MPSDARRGAHAAADRGQSCGAVRVSRLSFSLGCGSRRAVRARGRRVLSERTIQSYSLSSGAWSLHWDQLDSAPVPPSLYPSIEDPKIPTQDPNLILMDLLCILTDGSCCVSTQGAGRSITSMRAPFVLLVLLPPVQGIRLSPTALKAGAPARASSQVLSASTSSPDVSKYVTSPRPAETKGYVMQQTMIRVKCPVASLDFYCDVLGFRLVMHREFPQYGFNVYFVAPTEPADIPGTPEEQWAACMRTPGCIELTWNYGSETEDGRVYNTGNADAVGAADGQKVRGGFGHLGITVPDVYAACARFAELGCEFSKTPNAGGMKGLAFVRDPDGYLVEVLPQGEMGTQPVDHAGISLTAPPPSDRHEHAACRPRRRRHGGPVV